MHGSLSPSVFLFCVKHKIIIIKTILFHISFPIFLFTNSSSSLWMEERRPLHWQQAYGRSVEEGERKRQQPREIERRGKEEGRKRREEVKESERRKERHSEDGDSQIDSPLQDRVTTEFGPNQFCPLLQEGF